MFSDGHRLCELTLAGLPHLGYTSDWGFEASPIAPGTTVHTGTIRTEL